MGRRAGQGSHSDRAKLSIDSRTHLLDLEGISTFCRCIDPLGGELGCFGSLKGGLTQLSILLHSLLLAQLEAFGLRGY